MITRTISGKELPRAIKVRLAMVGFQMVTWTEQGLPFSSSPRTVFVAEVIYSIALKLKNTLTLQECPPQLQYPKTERAKRPSKQRP
jgi:hypothetical protein